MCGLGHGQTMWNSMDQNCSNATGLSWVLSFRFFLEGSGLDGADTFVD